MWRVVDKAVEATAAVCLAVSALMIFANVLYRYAVLGWMRDLAEYATWIAPVSIFLEELLLPATATASEIPGYLLVWISFLGAFLVQRQNGHICFDGLVGLLAPAGQKTLQKAVYGALLVLFALIFMQSVRMIWVDGATEIESAEIAQGWFMLVLPIATALLFAAIVNAMMHSGDKKT